MSEDSKWVKTFCGYCHANCGMKVLVKDGRMERVQGDPEYPGSRGYLCPKGIAAPEVVYSPQRLKYPLLKRGDGFERISWNEALDIIATKLLEIRNQYGPEAVVQVRGAPTTREVWDGFVQLMAVFGWPAKRSLILKYWCVLAVPVSANAVQISAEKGSGQRNRAAGETPQAHAM